MVNHLLVNLIDSLLGKGKPTSGDNYSYHCPFCNHYKPKLEVNLRENEEGVHHWHCWVCNKKGKKLVSLFKAIQAPDSKIQELKAFVKISYHEEKGTKAEVLELPKEYKPLSEADKKDVQVRQALRYLHGRKVSDLEIKRYGIGYCPTGPYRNMVIIPSYDENGVLNYFIGRNFGPAEIKYKNPKVSKNIIPLGMHINWDSPLVVCEGMFDAIAIKRNAVPLLGKTLSEKLMKKIVSSNVKQIFIALDNDALKQAFEYCQTFLNHGKEVFLIELDEKDPSDLGFEEFTRLIHASTPVTFRTLLERKLNL